MRKKFLPFFLAIVMALSLAGTASAAKIDTSNMPGHEMLSLLPATLQRPAYPATVRQTDPLMTRFTDFDQKEETWPYEQSMESVFQEMVELTNSLTAGKTTDTQKVKAIFEWVAQNIEYGILIDEIDENGYLLKVNAYADPLQVYIRRHARCEGYALMCQFMCTIAGVPTAYIVGADKYRVSRLPHAWNAAFADGKWIFFDATWNEWDMGPDYHKTTTQLAYYDGVFLIQVFPKDESGSGYDVRLRLRTGFSCPASVTVPDEVTWVDLQNQPTLTEITLSNSVTDVYLPGTGLTNVTLPNSMTSIGGGAFNRCTNLKSVSIPNSVTSIGNSAFMGCTSLKSITLPGSLTTLDNLAFAQSGLTSVTIPGSVTRMEGAFYECADLESVTFERGVTSIGDSAFTGCTSLKNVTIPNTVTTIEDQAFWNCTGLERVTIPDGVTTIGKMAFFGCVNLKQADLPDSVTSVDGSAFTGCTSLQGMTTIPTGMTSIGVGAFQGRTDLTSFVIPDHITAIGERAFYDCSNLQSVTIPDSVTTIQYSAFWNCTSLTSVTIPSSVKTIEYGAFGGCTGLTSMTIPEGVTSIGGMATPHTLTYITIPTSVTSIGYYVIGGGRMKDVYYAGTEAQWKAITIEEPSFLDRVTIHYNSTGPQKTVTAPAIPTNDTLKVDGEVKEATVYKINGANYFRIRDVAMLLSGSSRQVEVGYDAATNSVTLTTGKPYTPNGSELSGLAPATGTATSSNDTIYIDGQRAELTVYKIDGANYFKLRDLGIALDFNVGWTQAEGMYIEPNKSYDPAD